MNKQILFNIILTIVLFSALFFTYSSRDSNYLFNLFLVPFIFSFVSIFSRKLINNGAIIALSLGFLIQSLLSTDNTAQPNLYKIAYVIIACIATITIRQVVLKPDDQKKKAI